MFKLKCIVLAGKIATTPNLPSLLGQRGINIVDFSKDVSVKTEIYIPGKRISCLVNYKINKTNKNNTFSVRLGSVFLYEVFMFLSDAKGIDIRWLFIVSKKCALDFGKNNIKEIIRVFFGYIKSLGLKPYK